MTGRPALVIAHPGHELRVHGWLERAQPLVFVLTDGSGRTGRSRLASTSRVLDDAGASRGILYGRFTDRDLYSLLRERSHSVFDRTADELARALDDEGIESVVGDAVEGYNPGHDVCRLLINAALARRAARHGTPTKNYEFPLTGPSDACPPADLAAAIRLQLDDAALSRKLAAARGYPEMAAEVEAALRAHGADAFRHECLRPVRYGLEIGHLFEHPPFYERHGAARVAEGAYDEVIRFQLHLAPLAAALGGTRRP